MVDPSEIRQLSCRNAGFTYLKRARALDPEGKPTEFADASTMRPYGHSTIRASGRRTTDARSGDFGSTAAVIDQCRTTGGGVAGHCERMGGVGANAHGSNLFWRSSGGEPGDPVEFDAAAWESITVSVYAPGSAVLPSEHFNGKA
ncbi:hypothetical protein AB0N05_27595 [Nocardia sp. NPDC051030]|uniref:hypothetical protein n=1 Tax=Nocardia sp. NPDC051030 TaxID=3155162 RepID=UPI00343CC7AA